MTRRHRIHCQWLHATGSAYLGKVTVGWCFAQVVFMAAAVQTLRAQRFDALGTLPGHRTSEALAVSADGAVVVGRSFSGGGAVEAFRWTREAGMSGLGAGQANDVSRDGRFIAGCSACGVSSGGTPFLWTAIGGQRELGNVNNAVVTGVSDDGSVVVGYRAGRAFRWTADTGIMDIGYLSGGIVGGGIFARATDVSSDGSIIVGEGRKALGTEAIRWTQDDGGMGLGDLPGGDFYSRSTAVSRDGSAIVGTSMSASGPEAFRWTYEGGMLGLGDLPGGEFWSDALGVSADGSIVVGRSAVGLGLQDHQAFIWDSRHGIRSVEDVLAGEGLDLTGWKLTEATGISADGRTIVGNGSRGAWAATLSRRPDSVDTGDAVIQPGDANLDGQFDSTDLIIALVGGKYETGESAKWLEGDWDGAPDDRFTLSGGTGPPGDGFFNTSDLIAALSTGLFETGPYNTTLRARGAVGNVPEPAGSVVSMTGLLVLLWSVRIRCGSRPSVNSRGGGS